MKHSFVPEEMLVGQIRPSIKDKFGKINCSSNYRPVMSSCAFLKILEYCLLPTFERYVRLSPNQFGYRNGTSSLMCAYTVKEMIQKYISNGTPVFSCSLDMSKAFDCLNHFTLINKLIEMGLPSNVISVVKVMYFNQSCYTNYIMHFRDQIQFTMV